MLLLLLLLLLLCWVILSSSIHFIFNASAAILGWKIACSQKRWRQKPIELPQLPLFHLPHCLIFPPTLSLSLLLSPFSHFHSPLSVSLSLPYCRMIDRLYARPHMQRHAHAAAAAAGFPLAPPSPYRLTYIIVWLIIKMCTTTSTAHSHTHTQRVTEPSQSSYIVH